MYHSYVEPRAIMMETRPQQTRIVRSPHRGVRFIGVWLVIALALITGLWALGLAPQAVSEIGDGIVALFSPDFPESTRTGSSTIAYAVAIDTSSEPKIIIPKISVAAPLMLPASANIDVLNNELLKGAVHYPGSALPDENGNVFLFGHSTGLAVVHNKNFEIFNRIQELAKGDVIRIQYREREYWYRVTSNVIKRADAALVDLRPDQTRKLTLSTCRIFGGTDDRFVIEADFVKSYPLRSYGSEAGTSS